MGYQSYVTGEGRIEPALSVADITRLGWDNGGNDNLFVVLPPAGTPDDVKMIDGKITLIPGHEYNTVEFRYDEPGKFYDLEQQLDKLAQDCDRAKVVLNADFQVSGEEHRDIWRVVAVDNVYLAMRPKLVWPDGLEDQL